MDQAENERLIQKEIKDKNINFIYSGGGDYHANGFFLYPTYGKTTCSFCKESAFKLLSRGEEVNDYKEHVKKCRNKICRCLVLPYRIKEDGDAEIINARKMADKAEYDYKCPFCGSNMDKPQIQELEGDSFSNPGLDITYNCSDCNCKIAAFIDYYNIYG